MSNIEFDLKNSGQEAPGSKYCLAMNSVGGFRQTNGSQSDFRLQYGKKDANVHKKDVTRIVDVCIACSAITL